MTQLPTTKKLAREIEQSQHKEEGDYPIPLAKTGELHLTISPLQCFNEWVAVIPTPKPTSIHMPESAANDDLVCVVVGVNDQCPVKVGDTVLIGARSIVATIKPESGVYKDMQINILSQKNILMKTTQRSHITLSFVEEE